MDSIHIVLDEFINMYWMNSIHKYWMNKHVLDEFINITHVLDEFNTHELDQFNTHVLDEFINMYWIDT